MYCDIRVCLFVPLANLKNHVQKFTRGRGSVLFGRQCDMSCTSGFVDEVMFSHNGARSHWRLTGTRLQVPPRATSAIVNCLAICNKLVSELQNSLRTENSGIYYS